MDGSNNSFRSRTVNWHALKEAIEKMDPRKAAGYDGLQPKALKLLADELACTLLNRNFQCKRTETKVGNTLERREMDTRVQE